MRMLLKALAAASILAGCGADQESDSLIARVDLQDEGFVDFLADADGGVSVVQLSPAETPMYALELRLQHRATPAEVFATLAPGEEPPPELEDDHFRRAPGLPLRDLSGGASHSTGGCTSDAGWNTYWDNLVDLLDHEENSEYNTTLSKNTGVAPAVSQKIFALCHLSEDSPDGEQPFTIGTNIGWWFLYPTYYVDEGYYLTYESGNTTQQQYANAGADALSNYWMAAAWDNI